MNKCHQSQPFQNFGTYQRRATVHEVSIHEEQVHLGRRRELHGSLTCPTCTPSCPGGSLEASRLALWGMWKPAPRHSLKYRVHLMLLESSIAPPPPKRVPIWPVLQLHKKSLFYFTQLKACSLANPLPGWIFGQYGIFKQWGQSELVRGWPKNIKRSGEGHTHVCGGA